jgi:hypothetical protein
MKPLSTMFSKNIQRHRNIHDIELGLKGKNEKEKKTTFKYKKGC